MPKSPYRKKADKPESQGSIISIPNLETPSIATLTPMNFRVSEQFHREFKVYAAQHGMSMVELLQKAFSALKEKRA